MTFAFQNLPKWFLEMSWLSLNNQAGYELFFKIGDTLHIIEISALASLTFISNWNSCSWRLWGNRIENIRIIHILVLTSKNALDDGSRNWRLRNIQSETFWEKATLISRRRISLKPLFCNMCFDMTGSFICCVSITPFKHFHIFVLKKNAFST